MNKILVIDDCDDFLELTVLKLKDSFSVSVLSDPLVLIDKLLLKNKIKSVAPDLILLDINYNLSEVDGMGICSFLKNESDFKEIPIVFISSADDTGKKVMGFQLGATDFVSKPVDFEELKARITIRLKELKKSSSHMQFITFNDLKLDLISQVLTVNDNLISLTQTEFKLLRIFVTHSEEVLSRAFLLENVWGDAVSVSERTVDVHINALRSKHSSIEKCINSVYGRGYLCK